MWLLVELMDGTEIFFNKARSLEIIVTPRGTTRLYVDFGNPRRSSPKHVTFDYKDVKSIKSY